MSVRVTAYGAYGTGYVEGATGFAGYRREPSTHAYLLGQRIYDPTLRRFLGPDSASPFGEGGWNRYAYCGGDPVNRADPTGNAWMDWLLAGIGIVGAVAAVVASGGALAGVVGAAAAGSLTAAISAPTVAVMTATVAVDAVAVVADAGWLASMAAGSERTASMFGWVGMTAGFASWGTGPLQRGLGGARPSAVRRGAQDAAGTGRRPALRTADTSTSTDRPARAPVPRRRAIIPPPPDRRPPGSPGFARRTAPTARGAAPADRPSSPRPTATSARARPKETAFMPARAWMRFSDAYDALVMSWLDSLSVRATMQTLSADTVGRLPTPTPAAAMDAALAAGMATAVFSGAVDERFLQGHHTMSDRGDSI